MNTILMEYVCDELEDVEKEGLKAGNLDSTDKLVNIKKNLMKIEKLEDEGYSMDGGEWSAEGSYRGGMMNRGGYSGARRSGRHWVRGHYSYGDDSYGYGGGSYARGGRGGYSRRYSRAEAKESMIEKMQDLMGEATSEKERKAIEEAVKKIEKA